MPREVRTGMSVLRLEFITMIVTLTTDLGERDYYAGMIKGALLQVNPLLNIVDISHRIEPYNIVQASFVLGNAYANFPKGTIHMINVDNFYNEKKQFVALEKDGHYFIGPDNGLFSLIFNPMPEKQYAIACKNSGTFPLGEIFAKALAHILSEKPFSKIGKKLDAPTQRITLQPVVNQSQIRGSVIHLDNYGNVILNIKRGLFEHVQNGRDFSLFFKRYDPIQKLSKHYGDVAIGDTLCLFNSADYLEIAINMGRAASMLGLNVDDTIQIDFHETNEP